MIGQKSEVTAWSQDSFSFFHELPLGKLSAPIQAAVLFRIRRVGKYEVERVISKWHCPTVAPEHWFAHIIVVNIERDVALGHVDQLS